VFLPVRDCSGRAGGAGCPDARPVAAVGAVKGQRLSLPDTGLGADAQKKWRLRPWVRGGMHGILSLWLCIDTAQGWCASFSRATLASPSSQEAVASTGESTQNRSALVIPFFTTVAPTRVPFFP